MKNQREFLAPMTGVEAANRAQYVLKRWKYRAWSIPGGVRFERSTPIAGLAVIHPHLVHARIDMQILELPEGKCRISLNQTILKFGQPFTRLDKAVWLGDLEDVESYVGRREELQVDRVQQNAYAGRMTLVFLAYATFPALLAGAVTGFLTQAGLVGLIAGLVVILIAALFLPIIPLRMPDFPLDNALPPAPGGSNYIRNSTDQR